IVLAMISDAGIRKVHCETMDDIIVVWEATNTAPRIAEFVQVKTTTLDSLWSCARLCGSGSEKAKMSVFEKSLAKDKVSEEARFRIVTSQHVVSALRFLTFARSHSARDPISAEFIALQKDIDARCPGAVSAKGATSKTWLQHTLWVEGPSLEMQERALLLTIMRRSSLLIDQAEKILLSLLDWVRRAGDAKYVPDKDKKIITRAQSVDWWDREVTVERLGALLPSGAKLRRKMSPDVASGDMRENALELRRHYAEEIRSPKYMEPSEAGALAMDVRARLMDLRIKRFSGQNDEPPSAFHQRCFEAATEAAAARAGDDHVLRPLALGCLYDIVDRCQLEFGGRLS
ncbi:MAG: dsDNA nuclease domain-containing protein, partial [Hyphomicrobium sp.]